MGDQGRSLPTVRPAEQKTTSRNEIQNRVTDHDTQSQKETSDNTHYQLSLPGSNQSPADSHIRKEDKAVCPLRLRSRWHLTRDPALKAEVNRLQLSVTRQVNEWRNDQWSAKLGSLHPEDQSLLRMTKRVMRVPYSVSSSGHPGDRSLRL